MKSSSNTKSTILDVIKGKFLQSNNVTLDYEGDDNYLSFNDLQNLCEWLEVNYPTSRFYYTVSIRSSLYDILKYNKDNNNDVSSFLSCLFVFYKKYSVLKIVLVAGNKKYLTDISKTLSISSRFEKFIQSLTQSNIEKDILIGADKIFKLTKRLMIKYSNTKAVFLYNPSILEQLKHFSEFINNRKLIYALSVGSIEQGLVNKHIKDYLLRRGVTNDTLEENVSKYALIDNQIDDHKYFNNFSWFLFAP